MPYPAKTVPSTRSATTPRRTRWSNVARRRPRGDPSPAALARSRSAGRSRVQRTATAEHPRRAATPRVSSSSSSALSQRVHSPRVRPARQSGSVERRHHGVGELGAARRPQDVHDGPRGVLRQLHVEEGHRAAAPPARTRASAPQGPRESRPEAPPPARAGPARARGCRHAARPRRRRGTAGRRIQHVTPGDDQRNLQDRQAVLGPPALITRSASRSGSVAPRDVTRLRYALLRLSSPPPFSCAGSVPCAAEIPGAQSAAWRNPTVRVRQKTAIGRSSAADPWPHLAMEAPGPPAPARRGQARRWRGVGPSRPDTRILCVLCLPRRGDGQSR